MRVHAKFKKDDVISDRWFTDPVTVLSEHTHTLQEALTEADMHAGKNRYVIPALSYEAGSKEDHGDFPLFVIGVFDKLADKETFDRGAKRDDGYQMGPLEFVEDKDVFLSNVDKIRAFIRNGHTYQVNYTTRITGDFTGDAHALFNQLTAQNNGDYAIYIEWDGKSIVSCSPELFFETDTYGNIRTRPMKGTAKRSSDPDTDQGSYEVLRNSRKDQAENVMIVDLLRNDLSKIAEKGTVSAPHLFTIEKYQTVYQMTSTVEAKLSEDAGLAAVMSGLFPCGSITGAPKEITMQIISELETAPRGFYCGTIGIMFPDGASVFNVPIRTLFIENDRYVYGAGGGITYDSDPESEYEEMVAKTDFLNSGRYQLIETMRYEDSQVKRLDLHEARILKSAHDLSFRVQDLRNAVDFYLSRQHLSDSQVYKIRAAADMEGNVTVSHSPVDDTYEMDAVLAAREIQAPAAFLSNKTTVRHHYHSDNNEFSIVLYYNEYHQLTEFNIGNLVIEEDNGYFTPPASAGLLEGVMRQSLLNNGDIKIRAFTKDELISKYHEGTIKLYMINSLKEWVRISLKITG